MCRKNAFLLCIFLFTTWLYSCKTGRGLSKQQSSYKKYTSQLTDAGLDQTIIGKAWSAVAEKNLTQPISISLPYKETGYFPPTQPSGAGFGFSVKRGDKIIISASCLPTTGYKIFSELYFNNPQQELSLLHSSDTIIQQLRLDAEENGLYIFRMQPELLTAVSYSLTIETGPSLGFPVHPKYNNNIGSFWGVDRDGGSRRHEGIDIFAAKGTPAIAAENGRITRVNENNLGGKVVFMRPDDKNISLYYAHLDSQLVSPGQVIREGETIGLIGNTGNARNTSAHLHFGIYTTSGAVDPLPYVNKQRPSVKPVQTDTSRLHSFASLSGKISGGTQQFINGEWVQLLAATGDGYRVQTSNGIEFILEKTELNNSSLKKITLKEETALKAFPVENSAHITSLEKNATVTVIGYTGKYQYVQSGKNSGWINK